MTDPVPEPASSERPAALAIMGVILGMCLISIVAIAVLSLLVHRHAVEQHDASEHRPG